MTNLSIHKIFMDNVQTIKNIQISNREFHPNNEVDGENIGTNLDAMSSYMSGSRYINGTYSTQNNYKKYERITNILMNTIENTELHKDKIQKTYAIISKILKLKKLIY